MTNICISRRKLLSLYSINWGFILLNIELKTHSLISFKQLLGTVYIILVYMHIAKVHRSNGV